jgi:hypothetical protein
MINENIARKKRNIKIIEFWKKGYTSTEIARSLGITRATVMGIVHRAKEKGMVDPRDKVPPPPKRAPLRKKKVTRSKPQPIAIVEIAPPKPKDPVPFERLTRSMCKYVVTEGRASDYLFCGQQRYAHNPYCHEHCKICYVNILKYKPQTVGFRRSKYDPRA